MRLAELQRSLRDVLQQRDPTVTSGDPDLVAYLGKVASSGRLEILKYVIGSWRAYDLERTCPLTAAALKQSASWEEALADFSGESRSPFVEVLADGFLDAVSKHSDPLVASIARFERACRMALRGSNERFLIEWDRAPETLLARLVSGMTVDDLPRDRTYLMAVSRDIPNLFERVRS